MAHLYATDYSLRLDEADQLFQIQSDIACVKSKNGRIPFFSEFDRGSMIFRFATIYQTPCIVLTIIYASLQ